MAKRKAGKSWNEMSSSERKAVLVGWAAMVVLVGWFLLPNDGEDVAIPVQASAEGHPRATQPRFVVNTEDELVLKALPAALRACPGLNKYADKFEGVRVEERYRTTIVFHIPEGSGLPDAYKADGHNCFLEIEDDGSAALIEKLACKSVCLDQVKVPDGQLKLTLLDSPQA